MYQHARDHIPPSLRSLRRVHQHLPHCGPGRRTRTAPGLVGGGHVGYRPPPGRTASTAGGLIQRAQRPTARSASAETCPRGAAAHRSLERALSPLMTLRRRRACRQTLVPGSRPKRAVSARRFARRARTPLRGISASVWSPSIDRHIRKTLLVVLDEPRTAGHRPEHAPPVGCRRERVRPGAPPDERVAHLPPSRVCSL